MSKKEESVAIKAMNKLNPEYSEKFSQLIEFIQKNKKYAPEKKDKKVVLDIASEEYVEKLADSYLKGRTFPSFSLSKAVTDPAIETIITTVFGSDPSEAQKLHKEVMSAENALGLLLENYIADAAEPKGWLFCSGSIVKHTDFIKLNPDGTYKKVQVKSADNSENSSSGKVREDTDIIKWHRKKAKTGETLWANFPDDELKTLLNEKDFLKYVKEHCPTLTNENNEEKQENEPSS